MEYIILFLEGIITFISPCLLPMLPVYLFYFAGGNQYSNKKTLISALGFVCGFTIVFILLGAFMATLGSLLQQYQTLINIFSGIIIIAFGLNFLGAIKINFFKRNHKNANVENMNFISALVFGIIFSLEWTPCIGTFLGSALILVLQQGAVFKGIMMLLIYSLGLGIPFILSAVLINNLKSTFDLIKRNYQIINLLSGGTLIIVGVLLATGLWGKLLTLFS